MIGAALLVSLGVRELVILSGGAVFLLIGFFLILYKREQSLAEYEANINLDAMSDKWIEQKAQELIRVEAFRLAGDLNARLGQWEEAAELYQKSGAHLRAAECYLELKQGGQAARMFMAAKDYERAASLFANSGDYTRAAKALLKAGDPIKAARTYETGDALEDAAGIYLEQGLFRKAAEIYHKHGLWGRAAEALDRAFDEERARLPEQISLRNSMPLRLLARQAGDLFSKAERTEEAIESYRTGGWVKESAEALREVGRLAEAGEAYLAAGELMAAAESYKEAGKPKEAAALKARYHLEQGREREAVHFLEEAEDFARAAEIHKKLENWSLAGEDYEKAGLKKDAAEMFEKAGEFERAAAALMEAGDYQDAAALYGKAKNLAAQAEALEKAGDFLAAGTNYYDRGLLDKAISSLQKVDAADQGYQQASIILGQIFRERERHARPGPRVLPPRGQGPAGLARQPRELLPARPVRGEDGGSHRGRQVLRADPGHRLPLQGRGRPALRAQVQRHPGRDPQHPHRSAL